MATMASVARDIPTTASLNRDNLTVVADRSDSTTVTPSGTLPTPPNSISPLLPAHGLRAQLQRAKLDPIDSDLDLQDFAGAQSSPVIHEASGVITSALLARYHLPSILLQHGPLAIRHIMGYLTTSVPGFSGIAPTKARRMVVGALEGRGGEARGLQGPVEFEKVGWGRWDARRRDSSLPHGRLGTPPSCIASGIPIIKASGRNRERSRTAAHVSGSVGDESIHFSPDERDEHLLETEADKMSLDGSASASCSEAPDDDVAMNNDPEDITDDEDWAAMGAAALRAESYPSMVAAQLDYSAGLPRFSVNTGMARPPPQSSALDFSALGDAPDAQEREAVEALLRLGSV